MELNHSVPSDTESIKIESKYNNIDQPNLENKIDDVRKSIYIPLAVLKTDKLLVNTLNSLFNNSSGKNDINVYIVIIGDDWDYSHALSQIENFDIKTFHVPLSINNLGVGKGRKLAMAGYSNEDYVFHTDPHILVDKNWDSYFINLLESGIKYTNNEKTIITSYASGFIIEEDGTYTTNWGPLYSTIDFNENSLSDKEISLPTWHNVSLSVPKRNEFGNLFAPSPKFNANCTFGNKEFAKYTGLYESSMFWEEEFAQSINLFAEDFCMLFPTEYLPVNHFYGKATNPEGVEDKMRYTINLILDPGLVASTSLDNWKQYLNNPDNEKKIKKYSDYLQLDFFKKTIKNPMPTTYLNIKEGKQNA